MTSSSTLLEHARELIAHGAQLDERLDILILRGALPSPDAQTCWLSFARNVPPPFASLQVYNTDVGGDLTDGDDFDASRRVQITIAKPAIDGVATFVFQVGIGTYLAARSIRPLLLIADLKPEESFQARGLDVRRWQLGEPIGTAAPVANPVDPTRFVRDFVPNREVMPDLSPWILTTEPVTSSRIFADWQAIAARRLLGGLVSRAFVEDGHVVLQAAGPPIYGIRADSSTLPDARAQLTAAVYWVYLSGIDIEARHVLFSAELARASRPAQTLPAVFAHALAGAKAAYEAHVQSASRETLKVLADLRKTVVDETQKVTQKTQELTSTLWRDLAVSAAPLALKVLGDAGKAPSALLSAAFCVAAALFILLSFALQWRTNNSFFASQRASRDSWMQTLFSYISPAERNAIAETPIETAMKNYRETRHILLIVYVVLVSILLGSALNTLCGFYGPPVVVPSQH